MREIFRKTETDGCGCGGACGFGGVSRLMQWPVQIGRVPAKAEFFDGARLLIAADCAAYACVDFHERFMKDRITLIGCMKQDRQETAEKLAAIFAENDIREVLVAQMSVPCCSELTKTVEKALNLSGKQLPIKTAVVTPFGSVRESK